MRGSGGFSSSLVEETAGLAGKAFYQQSPSHRQSVRASEGRDGRQERACYQIICFSSRRLERILGGAHWGKKSLLTVVIITIRVHESQLRRNPCSRHSKQVHAAPRKSRDRHTGVRNSAKHIAECFLWIRS